MAKKKNIEPVSDVPEVPAVEEKRFSKTALIASIEFLRYRDLLKILLTDGETFTVSEVKEKLNAYLNKEV